jgi:hypothetical protein
MCYYSGLPHAVCSFATEDTNGSGRVTTACNGIALVVAMMISMVIAALIKA